MLLLLLACLNSDCDAPCEASWIAAHWQEQPEEATARLVALDAPVVQIGVLRQLSAEHPEDLEALCPKLSGPAAAECRTLSGRPHLWSARINTLTTLPMDGITSPWHMPPAAMTCPSGQEGCQISAAEKERDTAQAAAICLSADTERWQGECFFRVAEVRLESGELADAATLCLGAVGYRERCLGHLSRSLSTPAQALEDAAAWAALAAQIQQLDDALSRHSPALAARMVDRVWAESLLAAYAAAQIPTGDPLDHLPPAALPHIRAAAAWRMISDAAAAGEGAADWEAELAALLARRGSGPARKQRPATFPHTWKDLLPGEEDIPWIAVLRDQRRAVSADPETDTVICLLEALGRSSLDMAEAVARYHQHADPLVRWTVARLIQRNELYASTRRALLRDPSALVRQRLTVADAPQR